MKYTSSEGHSAQTIHPKHKLKTPGLIGVGSPKGARGRGQSAAAPPGAIPTVLDPL